MCDEPLHGEFCECAHTQSFIYEIKCEFKNKPNAEQINILYMVYANVKYEECEIRDRERSHAFSVNAKLSHIFVVKFIKFDKMHISV